MTEIMVIKYVKEWNQKIDNFINNELPVLLGYEKGTTEISMNDWFKAQRIIKEQNFYETGSILQKNLRSYGYDVKMDMQSDKLVYNNIR